MESKREAELMAEQFFPNIRFPQTGALITNLDGTVVREEKGKMLFHKSIEGPLKHIYTSSRPVVLNTLRFALSVTNNLGDEWEDITRNAMPVILLNGSQLGFISRVNDEIAFEQLYSECLRTEEISTVIKSIERFLRAGVTDFILFYYPEDWKCGEILWTPQEENVRHLEEKYPSASSVTSSSLEDLEENLQSSPVCMIFLFIESSEDHRMAYEHTRKNNFITHSGVDKSWGAKKMADLLNFDLENSIGVGSSEMDNYLNDTGIAINIGDDIQYKGIHHTLRIPQESLGPLLSKLSEEAVK